MILIYSELGTRVAILDLRLKGILDIPLSMGMLRIRGKIQEVPLVEGNYRVGLYIFEQKIIGTISWILRLSGYSRLKPMAV